MFVNRSERNEQSWQRISIEASYLFSVHLAKRFQRRRFFRYRPIRNKNCLWWPCLSTDRDEILVSNIYRGSSIDATYQVSVHLEKRLQRRFLEIDQSKNKNCLWWPCLLANPDEISNLYKGPTKFRFIWESCFRGEDFLEIDQSETRIACGGHVC
jgi:hypothetical protein